MGLVFIGTAGGDQDQLKLVERMQFFIYNRSIISDNDGISDNIPLTQKTRNWIDCDFIVLMNYNNYRKQMQYEKNLSGFDYVIRIQKSEEGVSAVYTNSLDNESVKILANALSVNPSEFDDDNNIITYNDSNSVKIIIQYSDDKLQSLKDICRDFANSLVSTEIYGRWVHDIKGWFKFKTKEEMYSDISNIRIGDNDRYVLDVGFYKNTGLETEKEDGTIGKTFFGPEGYVLNDIIVYRENGEYDDTTWNNLIYIPKDEKFAVSGWYLINDSWCYFADDYVSPPSVLVDGVEYILYGGSLPMDHTLFELDSEGILHKIS